MIINQRQNSAFSQSTIENYEFQRIFEDNPSWLHLTSRKINTVKIVTNENPRYLPKNQPPRELLLLLVERPRLFAIYITYGEKIIECTPINSKWRQRIHRDSSPRQQSIYAGRPLDILAKYS